MLQHQRQPPRQRPAHAHTRSQASSAQSGPACSLTVQCCRYNAAIVPSGYTHALRQASSAQSGCHCTVRLHVHSQGTRVCRCITARVQRGGGVTRLAPRGLVGRDASRSSGQPDHRVTPPVPPSRNKAKQDPCVLSAPPPLKSGRGAVAAEVQTLALCVCVCVRACVRACTCRRRGGARRQPRCGPCAAARTPPETRAEAQRDEQRRAQRDEQRRAQRDALSSAYLASVKHAGGLSGPRPRWPARPARSRQRGRAHTARPPCRLSTSETISH